MHLFECVVRTALITCFVLCIITGVGFFILIGSALQEIEGLSDIPRPLPPAIPSLRNARIDCINDIAARVGNKSFSVHRPGDPLHPVRYCYQDCDIKILQEFDHNPYYEFYGRVQLSKVCVFGTTVQESTGHSGPDIPLSWETDFFLVNRFNSSEALRLGGKGNKYFPEHYDRIHLNFGFEHP